MVPIYAKRRYRHYATKALSQIMKKPEKLREVVDEIGCYWGRGGGVTEMARKKRVTPLL
jgi:hypothetical protein